MNDTKQSYPLKLLLWKRTKASPIFNQCSTSIPLEIIRKTPGLEGEHWLKMGLKKKIYEENWPADTGVNTGCFRHRYTDFARTNFRHRYTDFAHTNLGVSKFNLIK